MTEARGPKLITDERSRNKPEPYTPVDHSTPNFKARGLNKRMLDEAEKLPDVEKRGRTSIAQF